MRWCAGRRARLSPLNTVSEQRPVFRWISRKYQGTGLGLPIVKAIMELHQGVVELKSTEGIGTEVTVIFPPDRIAAQTSMNTLAKGKGHIAHV